MLVLLTVRGRGKASGIEADGRYAHVWTMRDGGARRIVGFSDWESARRGVGLAG